MTSLILALALVRGMAQGDCSVPGPAHVPIHWSRNTRAAAPDGANEIVVKAILDADSNASPVSVRDCHDGKTWPLFTLERRADLYWSDDGRQVLVVDAPLSGTNKLRLFSLERLKRGDQSGPSDAIDAMVRDTLRREIGPSTIVHFYLPTFVSWKKGELLLAVGGETSKAATGPLDRYCMGVVIDTNAAAVTRVVPERELRATSGRGCTVSP